MCHLQKSPTDIGLFSTKNLPVREPSSPHYGVATVSRIDKLRGLFCRILSLVYGSFAKETCNFVDPTTQSHPIKPTWNLAGVEPGNQEGLGCKDLGHVLVQIHLSVHFRTNGTNQIKEWTRGRNPASTKLLVRQSNRLILMAGLTT